MQEQVEEEMDEEEGQEMMDPQYVNVPQEGMLELPGVGEPISYE